MKIACVHDLFMQYLRHALIDGTYFGINGKKISIAIYPGIKSGLYDIYNLWG